MKTVNAAKYSNPLQPKADRVHFRASVGQPLGNNVGDARSNLNSPASQSRVDFANRVPDGISRNASNSDGVVPQTGVSSKTVRPDQATSKTTLQTGPPFSASPSQNRLTSALVDLPIDMPSSSPLPRALPPTAVTMQSSSFQLQNLPPRRPPIGTPFGILSGIDAQYRTNPAFLNTSRLSPRAAPPTNALAAPTETTGAAQCPYPDSSEFNRTNFHATFGQPPGSYANDTRDNRSSS